MRTRVQHVRPRADTVKVQALAQDEEQVAFWRRHTRLGVALCVVIPAIVSLRTGLLAAPSHPAAELGLSAAVAFSSPLLLLVPTGPLVRHPRGRLFFDLWEAVGTALIAGFALLDGGAGSPYVMFFYVLVAHAALAYPPSGTVLAGVGNATGYLLVAALAGGATAPDVLAVTLTLIVATGTSAFASYNHVRAYRRTAAFSRQIAVLAARDGLTGCLNHRTFHERLHAEALVADRDHPLSLLLLDVDDFKTVNDTHGHPAGDTVLAEVGRVLTQLCRADDAAGRLGGDEFALLLPGTALPYAARVAERMCEQIRAGSAPYVITVSVGVAVSSRRGDTSTLLAEADHAVYAAKRAGRDQVVCAQPPELGPAVQPALERWLPGRLPER